MVQGTTARGFEYTIPDERMDDFETVELLMEAEKNPAAVIAAARRMLGDAQYTALKEHTRMNGKISTAAMMDEINYILIGSQPVKN